jgi:phage terminase large subunit
MIKTQVQIPSEFKALFEPNWRYLLFYGGRSSGKSHSVARALLLQSRNTKLRILCTRELQKSIKDSVHKLLSDLIELYKFQDFEIWKDRIINKVTGSEFIFLGIKHNTIEIKSTEGIDRCWVEEAQSITEESLNILTPTIRKAGSQIIFTFNRVTELDPVYVKYVMNRPTKTFVKKVNYDSIEKLGWLPDVTKLEIQEDKANKGLYAHKWLGEPLSQQDMSIIDRDTILQAMNRDIEDDGQIVIGADIARMGNDRTVFFKRKGLKVLDYKIYSKLRTTQVCDMLENFSGYDKSVEIKIDDTGVGGGVTDEMIKRGYNIVPINFGAKAKDEDKYPNLISEAWFEISDIANQIQLPYNSDLLMELSSRQWKQDNRGKRAVESKADYKKRGFRSPDIADACIICFYTPKNNSITLDDIYMD